MLCLMDYLQKTDRMKHITIFLSICWILWFSQIFAISTMFGGLSDIPATPAVITLNEKTPELIIDPIEENAEDEIIPGSDASTNETSDDEFSRNDRNIGRDDIIILPDPKIIKQEKILSHEIPPDERFRKIDDSGGISSMESGTESRESLNATHNKTTSIPVTTSGTPEVNITVEENPIPVFSEWAQKQMEEAEKKLEKEAVNSSSMRKNATTGSKPQILKLRAKNYASPDCGAKIISSNVEAQNTGALLTSSKDEYMLSPCTNRIWFVVELCEAIQAEKIDLANFELFSSSPKNFSVAVSNRFPTREWSNVGRFVADDQRNIQSFELHPHLFGKFVRVDIHSHYNSEHFCPISLFRVYGTSEFEAFETENRSPSDDIDEFEDDFTADQNNLKSENNLFKSASDAVISIVKKAAEALVKTNPNKTENSEVNRPNLLNTCFTPKEEFVCETCNNSLVARINYVLSCKYYQLVNLLKVDLIRSHIVSSQICANRFNLDITNFDSVDCKIHLDRNSRVVLDVKKSYYLSMLPVDYIAALCHIMNISTTSGKASPFKSESRDAALNLTIDRKTGDNNFINVERGKKGRKTAPIEVDESKKNDVQFANLEKVKENKSTKNTEATPAQKAENHSEHIPFINELNQITQPPIDNTEPETADKGIADSDVNIFNIVENADVESMEKEEGSSDDQIATDKTLDESLSIESVTAKVEEAVKSKDIEAESGPWEGIDGLLSEQTSNENLSPPSGEVTSSSHQAPQRAHSESVFIRLSNRIKALERNMSLSGQYLEELSRRYKKQVEELQHSFAKTLSAIEDQNRRSQDKEQSLFDENVNLRRDLEELTIKVNTWISLIIFVGAAIVIQIVMLWVFVRSTFGRQYQLMQSNNRNFAVRKKITGSKKPVRRRSVEGVSGHLTPCHKVRRPSEEAMKICGSYKDLLIDETEDLFGGDESSDVCRKKSKQRQRKISVIYNGKQPILYRQTSVSEDFNASTVSTTSTSPDDSLIPDEDYENYIPGTDLAYNEFMPDGPSGSQGKIGNGESVNSSKTNKKSSKIRRLSSPGFLKSPFSRNSNSKKLPHGPTGWEWYRSKKAENKNVSSSHTNGENFNQKRKKSSSPKTSVKVNGVGVGSILLRTESETMLNNNCSDDSLRTSGTSTTTGSLLSNGKSASKKHGSFKKILKKVF